MSHTTRFLAFVMLIAGAATAAGQEPEGVRREPAGVSFDFQAADLRVVISALAEVAGLNVVFGELPTRPVTLRTSRPVQEADVRSMLENVARANGLVVLEEGNLVRIEAVSAGEAPGGRPAAEARVAGEEGERRLFVHQVRYARAETIVRVLGTLLGFRGGIGEVGGEAGFVPLSEALREQREAVGRDIDAVRGIEPGVQEQAGSREEQGLALGLSQPVDMVPDPLTNAILVLATPADYEILQSAIDQLDVRPLQVLIEVLIAEVRQNRIRDLGVDVDIPLKEGDEDGVTFRLTGLSAGDVALGVLGIGDVDATVIVRALAANSDVTILSRPIILVQNNLEARILVGDQRPFVQVSRVLPTDQDVRDQVVQYRNVGTQLLIRPTINPDGYVNLSVSQEVSSATAEFQFGAPVINTREAQTQLLVKDGHTAVLGGLIDFQEDQSHSGIPLLKDIPLIGLLFRSTQTRKVATELVLLLTPHVLRSDEDLEDARRGFLEGTRELGPKVPEPLLFLEGQVPVQDTLPPPDTILPVDTIAPSGPARRK